MWATCMEGICDIFDRDNLGKLIAQDMTNLLKAEGLVCYPDPLPSQQQKSAVIMLKDSRFARGFEVRPQPGVTASSS